MNNYSYNLQDSMINTEFESRRIHLKNSLYNRFHKKPDGLNQLERAIVKESDRNVLKYISEHLNLKLYSRSIILASGNTSCTENVNFDNVRAVINLKPLNDMENADKLLKAVNMFLPDAGIFIGLFSPSANTKALSAKLTNFGFDLIDLRVINVPTYFAAIKTREYYE
jgi:hypothetical protein